MAFAGEGLARMTRLFARCPECKQRQLMTIFEPPVCLACAPYELAAPVIETLLDAMYRKQIHGATERRRTA